MVLAVGDVARKMCKRPAWIRGIDHRVEAHSMGVRDLTSSSSTRLAAEKAGALNKRLDIAELHAPFTAQEWIVRDALGLHGSDVKVNLSGGALAANSMMVAGLTRFGEAAIRIHKGEANRALAHATSGPALQQNMVALLEGE
jgi:acetyl-CoA acetyltransferase